jgi:hypothetical protein
MRSLQINKGTVQLKFLLECRIVFPRTCFSLVYMEMYLISKHCDTLVDNHYCNTVINNLSPSSRETDG